MKTSLKSIVLAIVLSAAFVSPSFADDKETKKTTHFGSGIFASRSGNIHIGIDKYIGEKAYILVTNASGKVFYKETLGKGTTTFRRSLNVQDLPFGSYTIEITCNGEKQTKNFDVTEKKIERQISLR